MGDWEGDTVHSKSGYLVTLVERQSRLVLIGRVADKKAETIAKRMTTLLKRVDRVHTITLDNGGEFAWHRKVAKAIGADVFFAQPYASHQRGTNENTNGLMRRYWPKGTNFKELDEADIKDMELHLNRMPRVILGGRTPLEVYTGRNVALIA